MRLVRVSFRQTLYELRQFRFVSVETAKGVFEGRPDRDWEDFLMKTKEIRPLEKGPDFFFAVLRRLRLPLARVAVDFLEQSLHGSFHLLVDALHGLFVFVAYLDVGLQLGVFKIVALLCAIAYHGNAKI